MLTEEVETLTLTTVLVRFHRSSVRCSDGCFVLGGKKHDFGFSPKKIRSPDERGFELQ